MTEAAPPQDRTAALMTSLTLGLVQAAYTQLGKLRNEITGKVERNLEAAKVTIDTLAARKQLAFYGSTPAYLSTLACHGWQDLHRELNRLSKLGRWDDMTALVDDEILETLAVVGPRREIAAKLRERLAGIADGVSLTHNRAPDPEHWADVVAALRAAR